MVLSHKISFFVPSKIGQKLVSKRLRNKWTRKVEAFFAETFGGATTYDVHGLWKGETGVVRELVTRIESYTDAKGLKKIGSVEALAQELRIALKQDAVAIEVDGTMRLIAA